jgi:CubicO group peptidase (beta-lactamase class C family)
MRDRPTCASRSALSGPSAGDRPLHGNCSPRGDDSLHGFVAPGFDGVAAEFERNLTERDELGAAFAAIVDGTCVADLWGGVADRGREIPWTEDTICAMFSGTKGLVAACLLLQIDRGALDLESPVCAYWPEFATHGKQDILVRHVVAHQTGLPGLTTPVTIEEAADPLHMARLLAEQAPIRPPGSWYAYHAMTFGWLCGELIRRVDGRSVGQVLREDIADPLDLELWIGLPDEHEPRVAVLERGHGFAGRGMQLDATGRSIWENPPRFSADGLAANTRLWRGAEIPSTSAIGTARSIARLYGCLARDGELDGIRILTAAALRTARRCLARGHDRYLDAPMALGVGFQLQTERAVFGEPADAFGHPGAGGSVHGAWPSLRTGFSYVTNRLGALGAPDPRAQALLGALHEAVAGGEPDA